MKQIKQVIFVLIFVFILSLSSAAYANNVSEIDIDVKINPDGSAKIFQTWTGTFDDGTENYIPINTSDIGIEDFTVSDQNGEYEYIDVWSIDADFNSKKSKCGINYTDDGVELCFGITQYGKNTYKIGYTVTEFIKGYSDYDGTNFMFINPDMSTFPTKGNINISLADGTPLSEENSAIWAFGYDGQIEFTEGKVNAYTNSDLDGNAKMIVMLRLNKGIVFPETVFDKSFEEVQDTAFEGSDYGYEEGGLLEEIIGLIILFGILALGIFIVSRFVKRKSQIKKFKEETGYFREVPNDGDIEISYYLSRNFDVANEESLIIGALMLSMINDNNIEPLKEEKIGMFGNTKTTVSLKLLKEPEDAIRKKLYKVLVSASGEDGVLQEKELKNYAYDHPESVNSVMDTALSDGETKFSKKGGFLRPGKYITDLTETGKRELSQVIGLKKYLEEFSLISERGVEEILIWQDYLVYATLFGIADKVLKQLEKVYPERIPEFEEYNRNIIVANSYYYTMHTSSQRALQQQRTDGLGGHASFGGGGGFSGGGTGGGSR